MQIAAFANFDHKSAHLVNKLSREQFDLVPEIGPAHRTARAPLLMHRYLQPPNREKAYGGIGPPFPSGGEGIPTAG
ncbi:hypothetical protein [Ktedonobacter sp. SOSP1-52]|uniref:hypothetical protein n=1 Tax=Ktedonobacter sp. SOSP1-52 TaxID=2778366 RepID=UPI00191611ED|nr:hypothetical protein [Ktedonobacter sp. SOSP1-52]